MATMTTIELKKENMKFSIAHFTIFSKTERERLHGHNYNVALYLHASIVHNGLSFDYRYYKKKIVELCQSISQTVLLPSKSPFLRIEEDGLYLYAHFNDEKIPFLKSDVTLLPLTNITVEELSEWFVNQLIENKAELENHRVHALEVKVYSAPGQSGSAKWSALS